MSASSYIPIPGAFPILSYLMHRSVHRRCSSYDDDDDDDGDDDDDDDYDDDAAAAAAAWASRLGSNVHRLPGTALVDDNVVPGKG